MNESIVASNLCTELSARFPEIAEEIESNREMPYLQMHALGDWLAGLSEDHLTKVIFRVKAFAAWCESQQRGEDAGSDIQTIFVVGFLEKIFRTRAARALLPHLVSKEQLVANADYLRRWVAEEDYNAALAFYK